MGMSGLVRRTNGIAAVVSTVALALFAAGCTGQGNSNVSIHTGTAYAGNNEVTIQGDDGWSYSVPPDVEWTDSAGTWHQGDRPACLPASGGSGRVTFGSTQVTVDGVTWRPVVWISCRG